MKQTIKVIVLSLMTIFFVIRSSYGQTDPLQRVILSCINNKISSHLGLRKDQLKICEGYQPLGNTDQWLWNIFDAVTPIDTSYYYNPIHIVLFSEYYKELLNRTPANSRANHYIKQATKKYNNAENIYAWNNTIRALKSEVNLGDTLRFTIDTLISTGASKTEIKIKASFYNISVFYQHPYDKPCHHIHMAKMIKPWYTHNFLKYEYEDINNWNIFFGPGGRIQQLCTGVIVADGIDMIVSITSIDSGILNGITSFHILDENPRIEISRDIPNAQTINFFTTKAQGAPFLLGVVMARTSDYIIEYRETH